MLDHEIDPAFAGDFTDFTGPVGGVGIDNKFRAELFRQGALRLGGAGADDARAEFTRDLNRRRADAARAADDERPIAGPDRGAVGEHVHGGAAGEGESGGGVEVHVVRQADEGALRHDDFSAKPPSRWMPRMMLWRQSDSSPRAQYSHWPQKRLD